MSPDIKKPRSMQTLYEWLFEAGHQFQGFHPVSGAIMTINLKGEFHRIIPVQTVKYDINLQDKGCWLANRHPLSGEWILTCNDSLNPKNHKAC
jgi:hypothetical protein